MIVYSMISVLPEVESEDVADLKADLLKLPDRLVTKLQSWSSRIEKAPPDGTYGLAIGNSTRSALVLGGWLYAAVFSSSEQVERSSKCERSSVAILSDNVLREFSQTYIRDFPLLFVGFGEAGRIALERLAVESNSPQLERFDADGYVR